MEKNRLLKFNEHVVRVLEIQDERILIIDCIKKSMPEWILSAELKSYVDCTEEELLQITNKELIDTDSLDMKSKRIMQERYTMIAGILPFIEDEKMRSVLIEKISKQMKVSKQTIRHYLCLYLVYQDISVLAPKQQYSKKELTQDEKNMRWALNKFFYNKNKNSISTAYTMMLKEKYCDASGILLPDYPSIHQFRYFYRKTKKLQTYYISRNGIKNYQRNNRPLLGDGIRQFAPNIGVGMLDATVCDIYLVNEVGSLVGRPILTACIDAYSGLCCGYSLSWEGGVYSLRNLMLNVLTDKVEWCRKFGIHISSDEWNCCQLPAILVTDMGSEYKSSTFEQIAEIGVTIVNLPPYRPELKGVVEKFFDLIQETYKKNLKNKGVIEPDYQERGAHDYRKDACLTMEDFERVVLHCIIYYNSKRVLQNHPYTEAMLKAKILPYANCIFQWGKTQVGANMISVKEKILKYTLLPRTQGKFSRFGLKVNGMRYKHDNFTERYLEGGTVTVAYNPEDVSKVWLIEKKGYIQFDLIESRYEDKKLPDVISLRRQQRELIKQELDKNLQAQILLTGHIQTIADSIVNHENTNIKQIRKTRKREQIKTHVDYLKGDVDND